MTRSRYIINQKLIIYDKCSICNKWCSVKCNEKVWFSYLGYIWKQKDVGIRAPRTLEVKFPGILKCSLWMYEKRIKCSKNLQKTSKMYEKYPENVRYQSAFWEPCKMFQDKLSINACVNIWTLHKVIWVKIDTFF